MTSNALTLRRPQKYDLFGVQVSATNYDEATEFILEAARQGRPAVVSANAVHAVVTASDDPELLAKVNRFDIVAPDGQPVRWALNALHRAGLRDRVRGSDLMLRTCRSAARAKRAHLPLRQFAGSAGTACRQFEVLVSGAADCRLLLAPFPPADRGRGSGRHPPDPFQRGGDCLRRPGISQAGPFCRRHAGAFARRAGQRGGGLRFSCRQDARGAAMDAGLGPGVAAPALPRTASPLAAIPDDQLAVSGQIRRRAVPAARDSALSFAETYNIRRTMTRFTGASPFHEPTGHIMPVADLPQRAEIKRFVSDYRTFSTIVAMTSPRTKRRGSVPKKGPRLPDRLRWPDNLPRHGNKPAQCCSSLLLEEATCNTNGEFLPLVPVSLAKLNVRETDVESIILKFLLNSGPHIGFEIAKHIRVPLSLISGLLRHSRMRSWWA